MRLAGKIAIVTGASSGLGKAMAEMFIKEGAKVVFPILILIPKLCQRRAVSSGLILQVAKKWQHWWLMP